MSKRFIIVPAVILVAIAVSLGAIYVSGGISTVNVGASLNSNDRVVIQVDHTDGTHQTFVVHPNTMTIDGESCTENMLSTGYVTGTTVVQVKYISLSDTTQTGDNTPHVLATELTTNGMTRATGTVTAPASPTWNVYSVSNKFTATGTQAVKVAGLNWSASSASTGNLWAYAPFTEVTLNNGDNITVTWTVTFTAGG